MTCCRTVDPDHHWVSRRTQTVNNKLLDNPTKTLLFSDTQLIPFKRSVFSRQWCTQLVLVDRRTSFLDSNDFIVHCFATSSCYLWEKCNNYLLLYFYLWYFLWLVTAEFHPFCPFWLKLFSAFILTYFIIWWMIWWVFFLISSLFTHSISGCNDGYW